MKKTLTIAALLMLGTSLFAQEDRKEEGFRFTVVKEIPITSTKNQNNSGTCWAFSSLGFFEAELLRMGKGEWDFSEMYLAHKTYEDRAKATVRLHGDMDFSQGGSFYDCVYCMKHYGMFFIFLYDSQFHRWIRLFFLHQDDLILHSQQWCQLLIIGKQLLQLRVVERIFRLDGIFECNEKSSQRHYQS